MSVYQVNGHSRICVDGPECSYYCSYVASLTKRPTSQFWVACFNDRTGRRLKRSTGTADRKSAQKIADEFEAAARRRRTALQVRRVLSQLHQEITGDAVSQMSVRAFINDWLERKTPEVASSTLDFYRNAAEKFLRFLGATAEADLTEITRDHITRFRNAEAKRFAPKTVNHQVKFLRMIFRAARRDALVADDPAEFVDTVRKGNEAGRRPFTIGEIKRSRVACRRSRLALYGDVWPLHRPASRRHRDAHVAEHRSRARRDPID